MDCKVPLEKPLLYHKCARSNEYMHQERRSNKSMERWRIYLVESREFCKELRRDAPTEQIEVLSNSGCVYTFREDAVPHLNPPAQSYLGRRFIEFLRNFNQNWLLQDLPLDPRPWRSQRRISLQRIEIHSWNWSFHNTQSTVQGSCCMLSDANKKLRVHVLVAGKHLLFHTQHTENWRRTYEMMKDAH